jgi:molybdopterin adenylyltransferase
MLPGFGEQMRAVSVRTVPTAILSRQTAGIRGKTLILNLPGNPRAIGECLDAVIVAVPYCLELIGAPFVRIDGSRIGTAK